MPVRLHAYLSVGAVFVGLVGTAILLAAYSKPLGLNGISGTPGALLMIFILVSGGMISGLIFKHLIPALCSECGGRSRQYKSRPVRYRCTVCGHKQRTGINAGQ